MTEAYILSSNRIIAKYMGKTIYPEKIPAKNKKGFKWSYPWNGEYCDYSAHEVKYHKSYDWIMEVVNAIHADEQRDAVFQIYNRSVRCIYNYNESQVDDDKKISVDTWCRPEFADDPTKLQAIWLSVVKYMEWYNDKNQ